MYTEAWIRMRVLEMLLSALLKIWEDPIIHCLSGLMLFQTKIILELGSYIFPSAVQSVNQMTRMFTQMAAKSLVSL